MTLDLSKVEEVQTREFEVRAVDTEKREFTGIAVPWNEDADIGGWYTERFERGAVVDSDDAKLWWRHEEPIGKIVSHRDTDAGWEITARISETPRGDEAYTLLKDGVVDRLSIGFQPIEHRVDEENKKVIRTKVRVRETSLVPIPAYDGAKVGAVRAADNQKKEVADMATEVTKADLDEVRNGVEELDRKFDAGLASLTEKRDDKPAMEFRSFGEYVKALAKGDEKANRVFTGAVSGDTVIHDGWVGQTLKLMEQRQRVTNAFQHTHDLPREGMNVEYGFVETDTTQVDVQSSEGDDLLFGKVSIGTDTAPVKTLGGWTSLSRQAIERTSVNVLDLSYRAMALKYARAIELLTRATVTASLATANEVEADLTTQDGVVEAIIDLVEAFEAVGQNLDGLFVAKDVFLGLLGVPATDRILQVTQAPTDKLGTLTIQSVEGNIAGLKVQLFPGAQAGLAFGYDSVAVRTQESPGAPLRLQDENVVNLTKDFSVYGYATSFTEFPDGLIKLTEAAS
jgi:HK97 family phage prohead protease